jgi:hypothetical protein
VSRRVDAEEVRKMSEEWKSKEEMPDGGAARGWSASVRFWASKSHMSYDLESSFWSLLSRMKSFSIRWPCT